MLLSHHGAAPLDASRLRALRVESVPARPVAWGWASQLDMLLRCLRCALRSEFDWLFVLSGQDYPLRPLEAIERELTGDGYVEGIPVAPPGWTRAPADEFARRYFYRWRPVREPGRRSGARSPRRGRWWRCATCRGASWPAAAAAAPSIPVRRGSDWLTLSRRAVEVVVRERPALLDHFRHTVLPTEAYPHSVLYAEPGLRAERRHAALHVVAGRLAAPACAGSRRRRAGLRRRLRAQVRGPARARRAGPGAGVKRLVQRVFARDRLHGLPRPPARSREPAAGRGTRRTGRCCGRCWSGCAIDCVLDVGAHTGGYGVLLRELGYAGEIVSFEPTAASFAALEARARQRPEMAGPPARAGDERGRARAARRARGELHVVPAADVVLGGALRRERGGARRDGAGAAARRRVRAARAGAAEDRHAGLGPRGDRGRERHAGRGRARCRSSSPCGRSTRARPGGSTRWRRCARSASGPVSLTSVGRDDELGLLELDCLLVRDGPREGELR